MMNGIDIAHRRLHSQQIAGPGPDHPVAVVGRLAAVQAQDYLGALWALGLRTRQATEAMVEQAIADRSIIRTWPMRGTLHFVTAADIRWMLALLTPRVIANNAGRYRQLELDEATFRRGREAFAHALQGGKQLSRNAMYRVLEAAGIATSGQRGIHILGRLAQEGLLCFGAREGKQPTFALLDEWVPAAKTLPREEALAELARRYFTGHGPATVHDFMWWTGLVARDARDGLEMVRPQLVRVDDGGQTYWMAQDAPSASQSSPSIHLLPGFDEYLLGYKDRTAVLDAGDATKVNPGNNGVFSPTIVVDGRVVGTWKRVLTKNKVMVTAQPFTALTQPEYDAFKAAAQRYGAFLERPATVSSP